ncbi:MAG: dTDP-glucose 4,6-dehydratase [Chlamydiae bacterium]|nr:dTDP-glucose 4,6-dehydratase [Chlamydiota bacterium]
MKRILITGGAGFLGSHLCERLLGEGHEIFCLDNLYTGVKGNIVHLEKNPRFTFIEQDVCDPLDLEVDQIYNLACPASPAHYQRDPVATVRTCVLGGMQMLDLAEKNNAKILQASTSEVYGDPKEHPQREDYVGHVNPIGPRACYDEGKRCVETLFFDALRHRGIECKVARIFNTYGPRMLKCDGRVVSNFVTQALENGPITIYGKGEQTRSFCYVDDLIEGLISMMQTPECSGPINLGNPTEFSILSLAKLILEMTGSTSLIEYRPLPADDPQLRRPDITRANKELGWQPHVPLKEGLLRTIDFFSNQGSHHVLS